MPRRTKEAAEQTRSAIIAASVGQLRKGLDPRLAALESYAFLSGLFRVWLSDRHSRVIRKQTRELIAAHIATRRPV